MNFTQKEVDEHNARIAADKACRVAQGSVVERAVSHEPLATVEAQAFDSGRVLVRVTSFRKRMLDEDNLAEKYFVDCCRYAGLIDSDAPDKTKIEVHQIKVKTSQEERTLIEISPVSVNQSVNP